MVPFMLIKAQVFSQEFASVNKTSYEKSLPNSSKKLISYDFEVYNYVPEELKKVSEEDAGNHFLGSEIAKKKYLLDEAYTYQEPIAPGNPATRTMYKKAVVYTSVIKIEKFLKKGIKSKEITVEEATKQFNKVLDVALNIKSLNTEKFEESIKEQGNNVADIIILYAYVHLNYTNN